MFCEVVPRESTGYVLRPTIKNEEFIKGKEVGCRTTGVAPRWKPYDTRTLAGIFWGVVLRTRQILNRDRDRRRYVGVATAEYVLRGYRLRDVREAWAKVMWGRGVS